jgi:signal transduction histidine kinase
LTVRENELRVLLVAPTGRDSILVCNLLASSGISCIPSTTAELALVEYNSGAAALILAEEALTLHSISQWAARIAEQPSWSDFPLIILTACGGVDEENRRRTRIRKPLGNVVLLERPVRPETFISTVQAALRSRDRQYQVRDYIARNRAAEEAIRRSEKLAVAGRLAASISHEINNPLAAVTNLLYLIRISGSLQEAKQHNDIAQTELARVSEIVSQTLRFYREPSKPTLVRVSDIVDSALTFYQTRLTHAEIALERDFRKSSPIVAMAGELRQVVLNLIGNALDALCHGGRLKIRISDACEHRNGARCGIRLTVADTGSGISPAVRKTLFEPFVTTKPETGTGLGLWMSSEIIRRHCGTIQVRSSALSQSGGTVFSIFLPLDQTGGHRSLVQASTISYGKRNGAASVSQPARDLPMEAEMTAQRHPCQAFIETG